MLRRPPVTLLLASTMLASMASVLSSSPLHLDAATTDATCDGTITVSYEPPLTSTPRATQVKDEEKFTRCTGTDATLTSGSSLHELNDPGLSCKPGAVSPGATHRKVIAWNNGRTSTLDYTTQASQVKGDRKATHTGTIAAGEFAGNSAVGTSEEPDHNPAACDGAGEAGRTGTIHLTISKP